MVTSERFPGTGSTGVPVVIDSVVAKKLAKHLKLDRIPCPRHPPLSFRRLLLADCPTPRGEWVGSVQGPGVGASF